MSDTRVSLLTPPGVGAIATVEVSGPRAWELARRLFRPAGKPLPEMPERHRFWFGTLGEGAGDEVILAATGDSTIEIHCHGGRRVVRWVIDQFLSGGRQPPESASPESASPESASPESASPESEFLASGERQPPESASLESHIQRAPTLRTASILLDQFHGAFDATVRLILESLDPIALLNLVRFADIGRHLVEPWTVVVAGAPNVGKSSLVNALAGYQRSVVSEVAGTTRDAVSVQVAFDGWPVELIDTAGLRDAIGLEAEGIARGNRARAAADLVMWVMDAGEPGDVCPPEGQCVLVVWNKSDLAVESRAGISVSALTGAGIAELASEIARRLVPVAPVPGAAVPYTAAFATAIEAAHRALASGRVDEAALHLRDCLPTD